MNLDTNNNSAFKLSYHLVLVIKYRIKVIDDNISNMKRTEIEIVPELAHMESNKQCFLNFLSES